jgi:hypothetical protein
MPISSIWPNLVQNKLLQYKDEELILAAQAGGGMPISSIWSKSGAE